MTYNCPVCNKPFDPLDKLFDFAITSHEKEHDPSRNTPASMIRYDETSLVWICILCGEPLHAGELSARQAVIGHCREKHGSLPVSSAPVTAGGGRPGRSGAGGRTLDIAGDVAEVIGDVLGGIARGIGKVFDGLGD
jgi:hypothetical protein